MQNAPTRWRKFSYTFCQGVPVGRPSPTVLVQFEAHAAIIEEVPAAVPERLVDQDDGKCLGFWHGIGEWIIP